MSLHRKENNLRRAQARFDRVSRRSKQFQIDFRREANSRGRFHTRAYIVRGEKTHHGGRGIVHKFANAKYRIRGDKPSVTRMIKSIVCPPFIISIYYSPSRKEQCSLP